MACFVSVDGVDRVRRGMSSGLRMVGLALSLPASMAQVGVGDNVTIVILVRCLCVVGGRVQPKVVVVARGERIEMSESDAPKP